MCLTAIDIRDGGFAAEAMVETLRRSALGALEPGAQVNLELALRADGRLGGHVVQGHVDGTGTVSEIREEGIARVLRIDADAGRGALPGGEGVGRGERRQPDRQRAVRGRVRGLADPGDAHAHEPGELAVGDRVNLEVDVLAKHVERLLEAHA